MTRRSLFSALAALAVSPMAKWLPKPKPVREFVNASTWDMGPGLWHCRTYLVEGIQDVPNSAGDVMTVTVHRPVMVLERVA